MNKGIDSFQKEDFNKFKEILKSLYRNDDDAFFLQLVWTIYSDFDAIEVMKLKQIVDLYIKNKG
jgi:hypothetical protein